MLNFRLLGSMIKKKYLKVAEGSRYPSVTSSVFHSYLEYSLECARIVYRLIGAALIGIFFDDLLLVSKSIFFSNRTDWSFWKVKGQYLQQVNSG